MYQNTQIETCQGNKTEAQGKELITKIIQKENKQALSERKP